MARGIRSGRLYPPHTWGECLRGRPRPNETDGQYDRIGML
jgi:hypothetical protein